MSLFAAPETLPFGIALVLLIGITLLEGIGTLMAASPSHVLDNLIPDVDADTGLDRVLGWLHLGKVPTLVVLVLFLLGYAVFGYAMQMLLHGLFGFYLPAWIAGIAAIPSGIATARALGALIAHIIPRDESSAVSEQHLIGRAGVIASGVARKGMAAQARVRDVHGHTHFLLVVPDVEDETFEEGMQVLIVRKVGAYYYCIANPHPALL